MPAIEEICPPPAWRTHELWPWVATTSRAWLDARGIAARDSILLLPFAALLPPARQAFAVLGGWQPRIETSLTLAASLGPPLPDTAGLCSGQTVLDKLAAKALLQRQAWAQRWLQDDTAGFERIVASLVQAAQTLRAGAFEHAPSRRAAFWDRARANLATPTGPAALEALLLQVALEWAAQSTPPATDTLFMLRPAAWLALQLGGPDPVAEGLMQDSGVPALRVQADAAATEPFAAVCSQPSVQRWLCEDFEAEAQAAATHILQGLNAGKAPVALVALDRALVRRVRALLERQQVPLVDETGWVLATTRAAARIVALLRAAQQSSPQAAAQDALLDWLKDWPGAPPLALESLEAQWRGRRHVANPQAAQQLWQRAQAHLTAFAQGGKLTLLQWLQRLHGVLQADGTLERLLADAAGAQVLTALHLQDGGSAAWQQAAGQTRLGLSSLLSWVQATLEESPYLPLPDEAAQVVLTPLARAFGRPFGLVVMPGADHLHLGNGQSPPALISDAWAADLGLDHAAARRTRQHQAVAHLVRADELVMLRRHRDDDEPLTDSPSVEWLLQCRLRAQLPPWPLHTWRPQTQTLDVQSVPRPMPTAAQHLPDPLSATQLEALRACPYRFFARAVLRLDEAQELDAGLAKRDYGDWLHAVLHHFHSTRDYRGDAALQLHAAAEHVTKQQGLDDGELLPWRASFEGFAPDYLAWCALREGQGWYWADGESDHRSAPPELGGLRLRGRIDRLDHGPDEQQQVLDYKTGSAPALKKKVADPLEDTQLAFYAALLGGGGGGGGGANLGAAYVALDAPGAPLEIPHERVHDSAVTLLHNVGSEWQRLREGAAMPALGEGAVCETCEARGLCRRDQWEAA